MARFLDRLKHSWDVFLDRDVIRTKIETFSGHQTSYSYGSYRPDKIRPSRSVERTIISSIYNRMSIDVSDVIIRHVKVNPEGRYIEDYPSALNNCLTVLPNIDQRPRMFRQDIALSLFAKGTIAIVPVETTISPIDTGAYDIKSIRVGEIVDWYPDSVRVSVYNEKKGIREELELPKAIVAVVENPFYSVMNEPSSTLQRLNEKLNLLDSVDKQASSGKLDLIIQLPYVIKSEMRRKQAEQRRKDIEFQLTGSQYGIAYTDGTERITQLNRPVENNLFKQVEYLTNLLYSQLGITEEILAGTASVEAMTNYYARTINPIVDAIVESMHSTFLTKTALTQGQAIQYYRDPFKLITVTQMAEVADKFTRNKIATSNEIRVAIGWRPSKDPSADKLENSNMPQDKVIPPKQPEIILTPNKLNGKPLPVNSKAERLAIEPPKTGLVKR